MGKEVGEGRTQRSRERTVLRKRGEVHLESVLARRGENQRESMRSRNKIRNQRREEVTLRKTSQEGESA